ncbi:MAG: bifunctional pyr operon transcriptional regulator/uracil phosphoribosyltransferase PyrR [Firmicutes bacterium]|nr:bifunctional pyr operon transcriptional regulator/uracil phosphoribosyltransferase PyrR [Bacillota bacterium]
MKVKANLFDENAVRRAIVRIAHEIIEKNTDVEKICIVGIKTRGVPIAERLADAIFKIEGKRACVGSLDISFYRDDLTLIDGDAPVVKEEPDFPITGKDIILIDDVIYTGRTVRAALDAILSKGRASKIQLAVLVDRGHRELPIRPDYVGKNVPTSRNEIIKVNISEIDGKDSIELCER